jgi:signal transduction histidine kinase
MGVANISGWIKEQNAQRTIERSLQESEQGRQRFIRRLDHEIKNLLTGLRAALVNLQETRHSEERQQAAENANRAVERLTRLLNDLRKLSDLEVGKSMCVAVRISRAARYLPSVCLKKWARPVTKL